MQRSADADSNIMSMRAGDDKLLASDVRMGVRLLANGTALDASILSEPASSSRVPAMFDDQEPNASPSNRRQSIHSDLLSAHEVSQVMKACIITNYLSHKNAIKPSCQSRVAV